MRGPQDLGGLPAGPVDPAVHEHVPTHWEKRIDAMMMLLFDPKRRLARVDESRRMQEALGEDYHKYPYYERWLQAISWRRMWISTASSARPNRFATVVF